MQVATVTLAECCRWGDENLDSVPGAGRLAVLLGRAVDAVLELPSSEDPQRAAFLKALDAPRLREMEQVGAWVLELDTLVGRVPILRIPVD